MIWSDIWHKYHKWYFKIVLRNFTSRYASEIWDNFEISKVVCMPNITYKSCYYLFYTTTCKRFVIFTCRYFKLSWNISSIICSSIRQYIQCTHSAVFILEILENGTSFQQVQTLVEEKGVIISSEIKIFLLYLAILFPWF